MQATPRIAITLTSISGPDSKAPFVSLHVDCRKLDASFMHVNVKHAGI